MSARPTKSHASFGGRVEFWSHDAESTGTEMNFAVFVPPQASAGPLPVLYFLSGLTCTEENFTTKAGVQALAAQHGVMIVAPDTSPRGAGVAGENDADDLGTGAGFYVDATQAPWSQNYKMHTYVTQELPRVVGQHFQVTGAQSIMGHSMGGHGALVCALRNQGLYRSVSAFAPIVAPSQVPWGEKAFSAYLGSDKAVWRAWDACALLEDGNRPPSPILVDQGEADPFLAKQLRPELLESAAQRAGVALLLRRRAGYDHSYYFIATFLGEHLAFHADRLAR